MNRRDGLVRQISPDPDVRPSLGLARGYATVIAFFCIAEWLLCSGCGKAPSPSSPASSASLTLLEFLRARGVLVSDDGDRPTYLKALTALFQVHVANESCGFGRPTRVTEGGIANGTIEAWQVRLPEDVQAFCAQSPDPDGCLTIFDGCRAFDHAILCDQRYVLRTLALAQATFDHFAFSGPGLTSIRRNDEKPDNSPDAQRLFNVGLVTGLQTHELAELLDFAVAIRHASDPNTVAADKSPKTFPYTLALDWAYSLLIGFVAGHEFAHLEQTAGCLPPEGVPWPSIESVYEAFVCNSTAPREIEADLIGAASIHTIVSTMRSSPDVPDAARAIDSDQSLVWPIKTPAGDRVVDLRKTARWTLDNFDIVGALEVLHFSEMELALQLFGDRAPDIVRSEPCHGCVLIADDETFKQMHDYYARRAGASDVWSQDVQRNHMIAPLRYLLFLHLFGLSYLKEFAETHELGAWIGIRFYAMVDGSLQAIQRGCGRSPEQQAEAVKQLLSGLSQVQGSN